MGYCTQTLNGLQLNCENSFGGIKNIYLANFGDVLSITEDEYITEIQLKSGAKFKKYECVKNTSSLVSNLTVNETSKSNYVTSELNLVFVLQNVEKRLEMEKLKKGHFVAIVEDANSNYWLVGYDNYLHATGGSANSGVNFADSSNYSLTMTSENKTFPKMVAQALIGDLV